MTALLDGPGKSACRRLSKRGSMISGLLAVAAVLASGTVSAADYYVSPQGDDAASGSEKAPWKTLAQAAKTLKPGDVCHLREGVYRELLRPKHSGQKDKPITFVAYANEKVVLTGADAVTGWTKEKNGVYAAPLAWSPKGGHQVFAGSEMLHEARWPNAGRKPFFEPKRATAHGGSPTTLVCNEIPGPKDAWVGARLWCAGGSAWICWTTPVTAYDDKTHTLTFQTNQTRRKWYVPRKGNLFALQGVRRALDAPGEWFYDAKAKRLLVVPPKGIDPEQAMEVKRRADAIDLSGRSHIHLKGLQVRAGGIRTDKASSHCVLERLTGCYLSGSAGVSIQGQGHLVLSCDIGYSATPVLTVRGSDHRIVNNRIHHGGYQGLWKGTVALSGRRILFSHNTVRHAGRDLINTHGLMESLVQYNDVSDAGWLTKDLGMFYGHNTDFANTVFRYNWVHDNRAKHCAMGIYFDHLSHNAIVHHNVVWNAGYDPLRFNNPSYGNLVFNNTCISTGPTKTFDHSKRDDLFACRYMRNILNHAPKLPKHVVLEDNLILPKPEVKGVAQRDFRLKKGDSRVGAYAPDGKLWRAGCDLARPPSPLPTYNAPRIPWMNLVKNACFEFGTLEGWTKVAAQKAKLVKGNGWGNGIAGGKQGDRHATGTSRFELQLGPGRDGVEQKIAGLAPNTKYTLSAWMRVATKGETVTLEARAHGGKAVSSKVDATAWTRTSLTFTTGPTSTQVTVSLTKTTPGSGFAWCDNLTLPATPSTNAQKPRKPR